VQIGSSCRRVISNSQFVLYLILLLSFSFI